MTVSIMRFGLFLPFLLWTCVSAQDAELRQGNVLSCETYSFRELMMTGKLEVLAVPEFYKELGIRGISYNDRYFMRTDDRYIDKVKAAVKKAGRVVTCYVIDGNLASPNEAERTRQIEADKEKLRVANRLGAPVARINVGGPGDNEDPDTVGVERVVAAFKELLPLAKELNIKLAIENHGGTSRTADNIVKIIQGTDAKWVGSLIDFGNFPHDKRYEEIAKLAPYAFATHVKVNRFDAAGEAAEYDFPRVLGILKGVGYTGPISIEYEGKGDAVEGVRQSKALIVKHW